MNKTIFAMLFGAALASAWWSVGIFPQVMHSKDTAGAIVPYLLSILAVVWIARETIRNWSPED